MMMQGLSKELNSLVSMRCGAGAVEDSMNTGQQPAVRPAITLSLTDLHEIHAGPLAIEKLAKMIECLPVVVGAMRVARQLCSIEHIKLRTPTPDRVSVSVCGGA